MRNTYESKERIEKAYSKFYYFNKFNFFTTFFISCIGDTISRP